MEPPSDEELLEEVPKRHAATYVRELLNIDPSDPSYGSQYFGQVHRKAYVSAQAAAEARWRSEDTDALRLDKKIGLMFVIKKYGKDALVNRVLDSRSGEDGKSLQEWVDAEEIRLIAEGGGPFKGLGTKTTLNLTHGGQGAHFAALEALNGAAWDEFCRELLEYEAVNKSTLVRQDFVSTSGYRLGSQLAVVRKGQLWKGTKFEREREVWLESRKRWFWKAKKSEEWLRTLGDRTAAWFASLSAEERAIHNQKTSDSHSTPEYVEAAAARGRSQWETVDDETRVGWCKALSLAHSTVEYVSAASERSKQQWQTADEETTRSWTKAMSQAHSNPCVIAKAAAARLKTDTARHDIVKASLNVTALKEFDKKIAANKSSVARRRQQLEELRKVSGWEEAKCKDLKTAFDAGVLANGKSAVTKFSSSSEQKKHHLSILRQVPGWEAAVHKDLKRAREEGVLPDLRKRKRPILATAPEPVVQVTVASPPKSSKRVAEPYFQPSDDSDCE